MSFKLRKRVEILAKLVTYVAQEFKLPSKVSKENDHIFVQIGKCNSGKKCYGTCNNEKNCYGKYDIETLVEKYAVIDDDNVWIQRMYQMLQTFTYNNIEDKKDPDREKMILTSFSKHPKYYVEKCPRSNYWHKTAPDDNELLKTTINGVECGWSIGSDVKSTIIKKQLLKNLKLNEGQTLKHLEDRWKKDLEYHNNEVRFFETNAIVGMETHNGFAMTEERSNKSPYMVKVFHGPRIFELMTYGPSCKAVLEFLGVQMDKLTVFGLTHDLCFIEETNDRNKLVTDKWDRELLGRLVINPSQYKRFEIYLEHQGTPFDLSNVDSLNIPLSKYNDNYQITTPINKRFYNNDGSTLIFG